SLRFGQSVHVFLRSLSDFEGRRRAPKKPPDLGGAHRAPARERPRSPRNSCARPYVRTSHAAPALVLSRPLVPRLGLSRPRGTAAFERGPPSSPRSSPRTGVFGRTLGASRGAFLRLATEARLSRRGARRF